MAASIFGGGAIRCNAKWRKKFEKLGFTDNSDDDNPDHFYIDNGGQAVHDFFEKLTKKGKKGLDGLEELDIYLEDVDTSSGDGPLNLRAVLHKNKVYYLDAKLTYLLPKDKVALAKLLDVDGVNSDFAARVKTQLGL